MFPPKRTRPVTTNLRGSPVSSVTRLLISPPPSVSLAAVVSFVFGGSHDHACYCPKSTHCSLLINAERRAGSLEFQSLFGSSAPPGPWHCAQNGLRPSRIARSAKVGS